MPIGILFICETKLDFRGQFHIHGFGEPYRFDRNGKSGGILSYIRDNIYTVKTYRKQDDNRRFILRNQLVKKEMAFMLLLKPKKVSNI